MLSIMHPSGMHCCCDAQRAARPDGWAAMGLGMRSWVCGWVGLASWNPAAMTKEGLNRHDYCDGGFRCSAVPEAATGASVESMLLLRPGPMACNGLEGLRLIR